MVEIWDGAGPGQLCRVRKKGEDKRTQDMGAMRWQRCTGKMDCDSAGVDSKYQTSKHAP